MGTGIWLVCQIVFLFLISVSASLSDEFVNGRVSRTVSLDGALVRIVSQFTVTGGSGLYAISMTSSEALKLYSLQVTSASQREPLPTSRTERCVCCTISGLFVVPLLQRSSFVQT
jgi:hypothetical protein